MTGTPASDGGGSGADDSSVDPEATARAICLRLLTGAPKTRAQLAQALRRKEVADEIAERVLDRLSEVGLVDDAAFAEAWVESRHSGRGLARRALQSELRQRGVSDETAERALDTLDEEDELAAARDLVARKLAASRGLDTHKRARRLFGMLARKGYSSDLAARVVREALAAEGDSAEAIPDSSPAEEEGTGP